ncbi:hypothetical protein A6035_17180 (plasmid) [Dietzia lutea]|uniref:Cytochrome n=2 Tax=Dietzia lutea TaxID=546160 RepID=A0A2S1RCV3_9ACTN|nr:hypothetical protein A6035_17180 [Dietzia lutea]
MKVMDRYRDVASKVFQERLLVVADGSTIDYADDFVKPAINEFMRRITGLGHDEFDPIAKSGFGFAYYSSPLDPSIDQVREASLSVDDYLERFGSALNRQIERGEPELARELGADFNKMSEHDKPVSAGEAFADSLLDAFHTMVGLVSAVNMELTKHPDVWAQVSADPGLISAAYLEASRLHPGAIVHERDAVVDTVLDGVAIPAETSVLLLLTFANLDPEVFPDPAAFKLERANRNKQVTFGGGRYTCTGRHLARMISEEAIRVMTRPNVEIALEGEVTWEPAYTLHVPSSMPVSIKLH